MKTGAWIMLAFGCVVLYGGLVWSLVNTKKSTAKSSKAHKGTGRRKR